MKILHVITSLQTGGAEKLLVDLLPRFAEKGADVELAVFDARVTPFMEALQQKGIKIHRFYPNGCNVYSPGNLFKLIRLIRQGKFDIVHTHNTAPQLFGAMASLCTNAKFITTEHNTSNRRRNKPWLLPLDKWMYARYHKIICISDETESRLRDYIGKCNTDIHTIYNGIDVSKYIDAKPSEVLESIAPGSCKIIMVSAFRWEKDQPTLIKAMKLLPEKFHLFLIGDGVRRKEFETLIAEEKLDNRVHLLGIRDDVTNILHEADYFVMSTHIEGFSLASVEAMCAGRPVIASDVDGLRQVVKDGGIIFPHQDSAAIAEIINKLDNDRQLYQSIAQRCKKRGQDFDISKMADNYFDIYSHIPTLELN